MRIKAYKRNFFDEIVLVKEGDTPQPAYAAIGISSSGDIRKLILSNGSEFWAAADEYKNNPAVAIAIENCGGKEELNKIFSELEGKLKNDTGY